MSTETASIPATTTLATMWHVSKQNVNILVFAQTKTKKKPNASNPAARHHRLETIAREEGVLHLRCRGLHRRRRRGRSRGGISEGGRAKKPPKRHRCYREWGTKPTPMPTLGNERVPALSIAIINGTGGGAIAGKILAGNLWLPFNFFFQWLFYFKAKHYLFFHCKNEFLLFNIVI